MKITWWNVCGISKFINICTYEFDRILKWQIICITETWVLNNPVLPSHVSNFFDIIFSPATKNKQKGRGSGGLMTLVRKGIKHHIRSITNLWIFIKITLSNEMEIMIGSVYISPDHDMEEAMILLREVLDEEGDIQTFVGGDFNGRIADQNFLPDEIAEECGLLSQRISHDQILNRRGGLMLECMEECGLIALNGRTKGDIPGQFTFIRKSGKSSVDLIWSHLELCKWVLELRVSEDILISDHLPVTGDCIHGYQVEGGGSRRH